MIEIGTASADLTAFVHTKLAVEMADHLLDDTVDLTDSDAVASCLIRHEFGGKAIGELMDRAVSIAKSRMLATEAAA